MPISASNSPADTVYNIKKAAQQEIPLPSGD
jgi:hypothetical protein